MTSRDQDHDEAYCCAPAVLHRVVGDEIFVLMPEGRVHWLRKPVARLLWDTILAADADRPATLESLVAAVRAAFEVDAETSERDVRSFVDELVSLSVLTVS